MNTPIGYEVVKVATIKVICFNCGKPVGKIQEKKGKAFCMGCQKRLFYPKQVKRQVASKGAKFTKDELQNMKKMMTPQEWIRRYRQS